VEGADRITVTFYDDTIVSAKVVGTDPEAIWRRQGGCRC